jgi:vancomycin resistance protein VanW
MKRRLFCEISPFTYKISVIKERLKRYIKQLLSKNKYASAFSLEPLPIVIYKHKSLIRRKLGDVEVQLQDNKAVNLSLAAPKINRVLINPGETFSFWKLVGNCTPKKGYKVGLTISKGEASRGIGGGMCQFTNLLHWLMLHSPLDITEHHHHNGIDLFPDFGRQIPFGTGTSIMYNYLDYQFKNNTENVFQIIVYVTDEYLCGELRSSKELDKVYHLYEDDSYFYNQDGVFYRHNKIYRKIIDKISGNILSEKLIMENHAKVMYDSSFIDESLIHKTDALPPTHSDATLLP